MDNGGVDYSQLETIASGLAFIIVTTLGFFAKFRKDKVDDTKKVETQVQEAIDLSDTVQGLALSLTELRNRFDDLSLRNRMLSRENKEMADRLRDVEDIVTKKYPDALELIKKYRQRVPDLEDVEIPMSIIEDLYGT